MTESTKHSRVHLKIVDSDGGIVDKISQELLENAGVAANIPEWKRRLKSKQYVVGLSHAALERLDDRLNIPDAVVEQYWEEVGHLARIGYLEHLGIPREEFEQRAPGTLSVLANAVREFYRPPSQYQVGKSQRYAVPVFGNVAWRKQVEMLARAIAKAPRGFPSVDTTEMSREEPKIVFENDFLTEYEKLSLSGSVNGQRQPSVSVLVGVHGGRDTEEYSVAETLAYWKRQRRTGLTLVDALSFYSAHPKFLTENKKVALLGDMREDRFVVLCYSTRDNTLRLRLTTEVEIDMGLRKETINANQFHEPYHRPLYTKPSYGDSILP